RPARSVLDRFSSRRGDPPARGRHGGARSLAPGEGQVRDAARGRDRLDVVVLLEPLQAVPDPDPASEHDRHLNEVHVIDQSGGQKLAYDGRSATDADVPAAGGFTSGLQRLGRGSVEKVESGATLHL